MLVRLHYPPLPIRALPVCPPQQCRAHQRLNRIRGQPPASITTTIIQSLILKRELLCEYPSRLFPRCPPTPLLHRNTDSLLSNPLRGIPYDQLMSDVEVFSKERGLTHVLSDLKKGALLAQDPEGVSHEPVLLIT